MSSSKKTTKKALKKTGNYTATVKIMGKTSKATGKTIFEAIEKLKPGNVAGMGVMTVSKGKNTKERVIPHMQLRRLFNTAGATRS
jgi:ABC-type phosphate/phosphonate transport system permease subunit